VALTAAIASAAEKSFTHEKEITSKAITKWDFVLDTVDTKVNVLWKTKQTWLGAEVFLWDNTIAEDAVKPKVPTQADAQAANAAIVDGDVVLGAAACVDGFLTNKAVCQRTGSYAQIDLSDGVSAVYYFFYKNELIEAADLATAFTKAKLGVKDSTATVICGSSKKALATNRAEYANVAITPNADA